LRLFWSKGFVDSGKRRTRSLRRMIQMKGGLNGEMIITMVGKNHLRQKTMISRDQEYSRGTYIAILCSNTAVTSVTAALPVTGHAQRSAQQMRTNLNIASTQASPRYRCTVKCHEFYPPNPRYTPPLKPSLA